MAVRLAEVLLKLTDMRSFLLVFVVGCTAEVPVIEADADQPLPAELQAGDVVFKGSISVIVPERGMTVVASVEQEDGSLVDFAVENPLDGPVRLAEFAGEDTVAITGFAVPNPCTDGAYHLEGFHWNQDFVWYFHASSTPAANSVSAVETGLQVAANSIERQRNNCSLADQVSASNTYGGRTAAAPSLSSTGNCGSPDGKNVVGFGPLPSGVLGLTCAWFGGDHIAIEADVKLTTRRSWFSQAVPSGCSNRWGIEQVATHEFGHVYGLAHVSQTTHPELTMSTQAYPCRNEKVTLGLGDVRGLRTLY